MKAKLTAIAVLALLATGAAHAEGRDDGPRSSGAVISNVTNITNDIHVQGYGLALGLIPFSSESSAVVDSTQSSNSNSVDLQRGSNTASVNGQALQGAQGAVGLNVTSGAGNVQSNDVALAAVDAGKVFASAQVFNNQADPGESLSIGNAANKASLSGSALNGAKGTIGVNIAAGAGELQENGMAASTNSSGSIAKATAYNKQAADNNSLRLNGCDPTNVASLSGTALMNAMGNIGVNIAAGAGNLQHNGLAIATAKAAN
ncbi:cell surface protein [Ralstonia mannitolilytica]|nr:hypothetical protein R76706_03256 [Ralstonia mannitolilytica]